MMVFFYEGCRKLGHQVACTAYPDRAKSRHPCIPLGRAWCPSGSIYAFYKHKHAKSLDHILACCPRIGSIPFIVLASKFWRVDKQQTASALCSCDCLCCCSAALEPAEVDSTKAFLRAWAWKREHRPDKLSTCMLCLLPWHCTSLWFCSSTPNYFCSSLVCMR